MKLHRITHLPSLPPRPVSGHKGLFGRILVVGGSDGMLGAPAFAGTAALRMGAGLVQIAVPKGILPYALSITPELIGLGLSAGDTSRELSAAAEKADVIVIGPGLGQSASALAHLKLLLRLKKPAVVDADGLNLLSKQSRWPKWFAAQAVLTPHPAEMQRLGKFIGRAQIPRDDEGRLKIACELAIETGQIVVLKGDRTVVTDGRRAYVNHTGDSTLSKAGTGDVLSGMIATLIAQMEDPLLAAALGVHLHGLAGETAGKKFGRRGALARDVIDAISPVIKATQ